MRVRSQRPRMPSRVCWASQKVPSIVKLSRYAAKLGPSFSSAPPKPALGVHRSGGADGYPQVQDEQCHGDGEQAVAQGGQALEALAREAVVRLGHAHMMTAAVEPPS